MNGKDIFLGLQYIGDDLIQEAEVAALSTGAPVKFDFTGSVCHVFNKETGINLEA